MKGPYTALHVRALVAATLRAMHLKVPLESRTGHDTSIPPKTNPFRWRLVYIVPGAILQLPRILQCHALMARSFAAHGRMALDGVGSGH